LIGLALAVFALFKYYSNSSVNTITGEKQHVALSADDEITLGLQAAPGMVEEFGGMSSNHRGQALVAATGERLVSSSVARNSPYSYQFHLLADSRTINAFALPGGQIFITEALFNRLTTNGTTVDADMLAGVLGHEIGHVVARHSAEKMAQMELSQGLTGAVTMATYDPANPNTAYLAQVVGNLIQLKYGRDQELQSDNLGVRLMLEAGYNPEKLIAVMEVLKQAAGPDRTPEFQSSHPDPENRAEKIREAIDHWKAAAKAR
jgi:predicted Zn-dependent protease